MILWIEAAVALVIGGVACRLWYRHWRARKIAAARRVEAPNSHYSSAGVRDQEEIDSVEELPELRDGLVDRLLTGGGYVCYSTPAEQLIRLGHRYNVPVYPCINCPANYTLGGNNLRAAASNFWWAGADGLYLWNFQYSGHE